MEPKKAPLKATMLGFSGIIPFAATTAAFALGKGEPRAALVLWWFPNDAAVWGLMMGFIVMGLADRLRPGLNVPAWMAPLRTRLTLAVVSCHLIVIGTG